MTDRERVADALSFYIRRCSWAPGDTEREAFERLLRDYTDPRGEPHLQAMREQPVHDEPVMPMKMLDDLDAMRPTEGHTSRQLSRAAELADHEHCAEMGQCWSGSPTNACNVYGCHPCPTPGHQNEGRCNRCGQEA